jgi:predicted TIM-barrel fold metal-dependent hydrolase
MIEGGMVIDFHGHPGRWGLTESSPENLLNSMDAIGVDKSVLFNIWHPEGTRGNDDTASMVAGNPDRFIGFAYVSPLLPDTIGPELTRAFDELHLTAIKLYPPFTGINLNEPPWDPIYEFANERELLVIWHTGIEATTWPKFVGDVAPRFPKATFVCGHSGNCPPMRAQAIEVAQNNANVYLETCSTFRSPGAIEELVNGAGADRVLYGSDVPLMDHRPQVGKIVTADISDDAKRLVLGENAKRILKLP